MLLNILFPCMIFSLCPSFWVFFSSIFHFTNSFQLYLDLLFNLSTEFLKFQWLFYFQTFCCFSNFTFFLIVSWFFLWFFFPPLIMLSPGCFFHFLPSVSFMPYKTIAMTFYFGWSLHEFKLLDFDPAACYSLAHGGLLPSGFAICDCELILSRACGLDCELVPPLLGFPSAQTVERYRWPRSGFYVNWSAVWVV